jgi:hypothetical protein
MSFPPATEMFQFAGFASCTYGFSAGYPLRGGLPHSEIPGSTIARISPGLFAACHVLHRLSVPRHPPDALHSRLSATPNGKNHIRCNNIAPRRQAKPKVSPKASVTPRFTKKPLAHKVRQNSPSQKTLCAGSHAQPFGPPAVSRLGHTTRFFTIVHQHTPPAVG